MIQKDSEDEGPPEAQQTETKDDMVEEDQPTQKPSKRKNKRKARQRKQKEDLKSKTTGVGLKISVDSAPKNNKIVFDDSNLPSDDEDKEDDSTNDKTEDVKLNSKIKMGGAEGDDDDDDDDAVEEVQGKAARDEAMDQMKTEAKQSLKTKKKRKRKTRMNKAEKEDGDDDDEMDADFFSQLDSARKEELEEREELEKSAAREALRGKHTTFVFAKNKDDDDAVSDPVPINDSIQVVVLKNPGGAATGKTSFVAPTASVSEKALLYSRNRLTDGHDRLAGAAERKRQRNHSGEKIQPWKRSKKRVTMRRSRLTKGKPATFFKTKKR